MTLWNRGVILPKDRWIIPEITKYRRGLYSDKAGVDEMSFGELAMVDIATTAHACKLLIVREITGLDPQYGSMGIESPVEQKPDGSTKLKPIYEALPRFLDVERRCLMDLGLAKKLPQPRTISELLAEPEDEDKAEGQTEG